MEKEFLWPNEAFIVDGDNVWFIPFFYSFLCRYNLNTKKVEEAIAVPEITAMMGSFYYFVKINRNIFMIPANEKSIFIYDIDKKKYSVIQLKDYMCKGEKFRAYAVWKEWLYIFPVFYPYIVKINVTTYEINYIADDRISDFIQKNLPVFRFQHVQAENKIYLLFYHSNVVFEFDMNTDEGKCFAVGNKNMRFTFISAIGINQLVLLDESGDIIIADRKEGYDTKRICHCDDNFRISDCIKIENTLFIFPYSMEGKIKRFDLKTFEFEKAGFSDFMCKKNLKFKWWNYNAFSCAVYIDGKLYVFNIPEQCLYEIFIEKSEVKRYFIRMKNVDKLITSLFENYRKSYFIFYENSERLFNLENYSRIIKESYTEIELNRINIGLTIYQRLKLEE